MFEIGLYWRRATYFWTLIAAAFFAYFAIQASSGLGTNNKIVFTFVVAVIGFVFSLGWFLINRGSKFWQLNWEIQVDRIESKLNEALHRTLARQKDRENGLVGPGRFSVSKINQLTSLYVVLVWVGLGIWSCVLWCAEKGILSESGHNWFSIVFVFVFLMLTFWICVLFWCKGKSEIQDSDYTEPYQLVTRTPERRI